MFDLEKYYSYLRTLNLGRPCIYIDKIESTITEAFSHKAGTLIVAGQQTKGRGQRNNVWHSPTGCAMASLKLACARQSQLGLRLTFLQHLVGLSILKTLQSIDPERLGTKSIKLKWPNDIMYLDQANSNPVKIGGILVNSEHRGEILDLVLSFGLNVSNAEPTTCLNSITKKNSITVDMVVAQIVNHLESYTLDFDNSKFDAIKREYMDRCININQLVEDEKHGCVKVYGIDDDGYLIGKRILDDKLCLVTRILK